MVTRKDGIMFNLRSKESIRYFKDQELKRLFLTMKNEVKCSFREMEETEEGSKERKLTTEFYRWTVRDVAFFKLLYFGAFKVRDLNALPLEYYDLKKNELHCKKSKNGICITLTLDDKSILDSLKLHLEVNKPKKFLFEEGEGKPLSRKLVDWRFPQYCELAQIENEEKWQWQTLLYTRIKNILRKTPKIAC